MLHKDPFIISAETFTLIQQLQSIDELKNFHLVGGTALALQLGHRNSIDIDLFTLDIFNSDDVIQLLREQYSVVEIFKRNNTIISLVNNIKTDFIRHNYPILKPPIIEEGISMLSLEDIAAMKVHVIAQSGKRIKDFIDIYFLLQHFCMDYIIKLFSQKYDYINPLIALKALNYFDDIDESIDPPKLVKPLQLAQIKKRISEATLNPQKIFK